MNSYMIALKTPKMNNKLNRSIQTL